MTIEVIPTVGSLSIGFDGKWLEIIQGGTGGNEDQVILIPHQLVEAFLGAINRSMGGE